MDNLTHSLLAVSLSRAGLNRLAPHSGWLLLLAANIPDGDLVTAANGQACYLAQHRGWTHSVALSPVMAVLPLALWWLLTRKQKPSSNQWIGAYLVSLAGIVSHFLLDWLNVYGVRLMLPFNGNWYRLDWVYIVDLWIWGILAIALIAPLLTRLVYSEIGAKAGGGRGAAWVALFLFGAYLFVRSETHARAVALLDSRLYGGNRAVSVAALPSPENPLRWTGVVETDTEYRVLDLHLLHEFDPEGGRVFFKPDHSRVVRAVKATDTGRAFFGFTQMPLWRIIPASDDDGSTRVEVTDLRFGLPEEHRFVAQFDIDAQGRVTRESFSFEGGAR